MRKAILSLLKHPVFWLLPIFWSIWANLRRTRFLVAEFSPDAVSYELLSRAGSLAESLSSVRTLGYAWFLKLLRTFSPEYQAAPTMHLAVYFGVVLLFWWSVRRYTGSGWLAFAWSLPVAYPCNLAFIKYVQPDFLGPALAIAVVALLIALAARPAGLVIWVLLTVTTFGAIQMRPDNLFLLVLLPLGGVVLAMCRRILDPKRLLRFAAGLLAIAVVPLVLFMVLRWSVVGHFGLVPFGGYNLIGVTASFLDEELVRELPVEEQPLAAAILEGREVRKLRPYRMRSWTKGWQKQYGPNVWRVAEPIAREMLTDAVPLRVDGVDVPPVSGSAVFTINAAFKKLSREIIWKRPALYMKWVYESFLIGLGMIFQCAEFGYLLGLLALSAPFLLVPVRRSDPRYLTTLTDRALQLYGLALVGGAYFLGRLLLTVLVSTPYDRYLLPSMVFLPGIVAAALFELWRRVLSSRSQA